MSCSADESITKYMCQPFPGIYCSLFEWPKSLYYTWIISQILIVKMARGAREAQNSESETKHINIK